MSVFQILINGIVLFFLYRFLLKTLGVEQLGIWSLVLATTSVMNIANFGFSGGVVKFVAQYIAREKKDIALKVIQTASISVSIFIGFALIIAFPIIKWILSLVIPYKNLPLAFSILPYSFLSLWIMSVTSTFQSGLDGCQRIDLRNILSMGSASLYLFLCFIFAPKYGLLGVAYSQVIQSIVILIFSKILLRNQFKEFPFYRIGWDKNIFKEILGYGVNFQIISVTTMFYDPITKALLSKFGGLSMVGYYEMANKMILQLRALIVSANQVLVPAIANLHETIPNKIRNIYSTSYQLLFYLSLPLYTLIIITAPIISEIWIGHYEKVFIIFSTLLSAGWFLNTLNAPAYFSNLGTGELRWNVIGHISIAILNVVLGGILGLLFGGYGVVTGSIIALSIGSSIIYLTYHLKNKIPFSDLIPKASRLILFTCIFGIIINIITQIKFKVTINSMIINYFIIFIFTAILFIFLWIHPMRKRLMWWISNDLLKGEVKANL